jgi:hypothetical protein
MARKLLHVTMMVDASIIHELLTLIAGKAIGAPEIKPVSHGGEAENGAVKDRPSVTDVVLALAQSRASFNTKEAAVEAARFGYQKGTIYTACSKLTTDGTLKRIGTSLYALASKAPPSGEPTGLRKGGQPERVLAIVREKQNGSGLGVTVQDIRAALGKKGNISPSITDLVRKKLLTKVGPAAYRAVI